MSNLPLSETPVSQPPEFYRLPQTGKRDPYFGCSRSWYIQAEKARLLKLVRVRAKGKLRGIVLVPYDAMTALIKHQQSIECTDDQ